MYFKMSHHHWRQYIHHTHTHYYTW